jgi:MSHA biogenesis protein MshQ
VPGYLQYDWDSNGSDDNPTGIATFGIYRGDDRIIFWRELQN